MYSVSVVHQPVNDDHRVPFALAIADLDDGWTMLTHVVGCAPDAVRIGMRIRFDPDAARSRRLPLFRPAGPAGGADGYPGSAAAASRTLVYATVSDRVFATPLW